MSCLCRTKSEKQEGNTQSDVTAIRFLVQSLYYKGIERFLNFSRGRNFTVNRAKTPQNRHFSTVNLMKASKKYEFSAISIKADVAKKFRRFSKKVSTSHTETLQLVISFFEDHNLSPNENLGDNMKTLEGSIKKRINALIAIIKDIEKNQTKPTTAMLQTLFEETSKMQEPEEEVYNFGSPQLITENEELTYYRTEYEKCQQKFHQTKNQLKELLQKASFVRGNFGGGYVKLNISKDELQQLKTALENVHHN